MIALEALKKFCSCVRVSEVFCEVRSARVRAIGDTLRSDATPEQSSTVPKNITSISGTMKANSVARCRGGRSPVRCSDHLHRKK
jgi:hypothetical protein